MNGPSRMLVVGAATVGAAAVAYRLLPKAHGACRASCGHMSAERCPTDTDSTQVAVRDA